MIADMKPAQNAEFKMVNYLFVAQKLHDWRMILKIAKFWVALMANCTLNASFVSCGLDKLAAIAE